MKDRTADRYLFWTSLDTSKVGAGAKIPVLIQTGDGNTMSPKLQPEGEQKERTA